MRTELKAKTILKFSLLVTGLGLVYALAKFTPLSIYFEKETIVQFVRSLNDQWWGPLAYITLYAAACAFAIPGSLLTLAGGAVFGTLHGTIYTTIAANLGASLAFFEARFLGQDFIGSLFKKGKLGILDEKAASSGFQTILTLRLLPAIPFNGLNFGAGMSKIRYRDYALGTILGMLPATVVYTYFADALLSGATRANRQAYMHVAIAAILLIALSFVPKIYKKLKR